jgi:LPS-assembly lipoprotein
MWSLRPALIGILLLVLGSCGFHPLYGKNGADPQVNEELAEIQIDPLRDRQGQLIHNALIKALNPEGSPDKPRYHLQVAYSITQSQQALQTDDTATRNVLNYSILYRLYEGSTAVTAGTFSKIFSYNFLQQHYSNVAAQTDIEHRAAEVVTVEVRNRLAIYFTDAAMKRADAAKTAAAKAAADKEETPQ